MSAQPLPLRTSLRTPGASAPGRRAGDAPPGPRHFLDLADVPGEELRAILDWSRATKAARRKGEVQAHRPLLGRKLAMIFDKPSTRTRVSFDVGIRELGGEPLLLTGAEMQLGRGETIADTARVLSRYVDAIMIRILDHAALKELAAHAAVPVINGLTKHSHPCQVMADVMTFEERRGPIGGRTVAWVGDSNNVLASWMEASARFGFRLTIATPGDLAPKADAVARARRLGADILVTDDPQEAVRDADAVVTDCWVSMGDEDEGLRHNLLKPYQVNGRLMREAAREAVFLHCLPAHRGEEVTDEVMDGPQSAVFDEAENRLHAQKGILAWCLDAMGPHVASPHVASPDVTSPDVTSPDGMAPERAERVENGAGRPDLPPR